MDKKTCESSRFIDFLVHLFMLINSLVYLSECERMKEQKVEKLASSYRWWHLNRSKDERAAFESHMKRQGGMKYLTIPSFL